MTAALIVRQAGPGVSVQDLGRPGYLAFGLSRGGAADQLALVEGAALLGQESGLAALEMAGMGGVFEATEDTRIALTGAPMRASLEGAPLQWNASHLLAACAQLNIGPAIQGIYGYLHVGGGFATPERLSGCGAHLAAGLGAPVVAGDVLPLGGELPGREVGRLLPHDARFGGGTIRLIPSLQTTLFSMAEIARFEATTFARDARGNRMGARMASDGEGFHTSAGLSVLSEIIVPGDVQIVGDGAPLVLLAECQTTGGYPRIGTVLPCDLSIVAQAPPKAEIRFRFLSPEAGLAAERKAAARVQALQSRIIHLLRDPHGIRDLLSYQLVSGATAGTEG